VIAASTQRTELAHRASGGIDVYLFWDEPTGRVTVGVLDSRGDDCFEFEVDGRHALDAFNHPYAYAENAHQRMEDRPCTHGSITRQSPFPAP
jgi:hypothetical protein